MPFDKPTSEGVRRATVEDIPFLAELARERYPVYRLEQAELWARTRLGEPNIAAFICGMSAGFVAWQNEMWLPELRVADVLPLFSRPCRANPLGPYPVLKAMIEWASEQGCYAIRFGSSEGARGGLHSERRGFDVFAGIAKRLGARPWGKTYIVELKCLQPSSQQ